MFASLVAITASVGAQFEPGAWYEQLTKPAWNPPDWVFAPVWTALYIAVAAAGWLTWRRSQRLELALLVWMLQLVANGLWSWLFFGLHEPAIAFIDVVVLFGLIVWFIALAQRHSAAASWLFAPYALWVVFVAALNAAIWQAN
ncbi:MAG: TspO/MBR family protein [Steroidobacteraceae bacterium]